MYLSLFTHTDTPHSSQTFPLSLPPCSDGGKTLTFFNNDYKGDFQTVTFEGPDIQQLFYGSFHKVNTICALLLESLLKIDRGQWMSLTRSSCLLCSFTPSISITSSSFTWSFLPLLLPLPVSCPAIFSLIQLHVAVSKTSARILVDCKTIGEKTINAAGNISTDGMEVLGRMVRSRGSKDSSAPVGNKHFSLSIILKLFGL